MDDDVIEIIDCIGKDSSTRMVVSSYPYFIPIKHRLTDFFFLEEEHLTMAPDKEI